MKDQELEVEVGQALCARGWTLAVAESCTGGLVGHRLTEVPGSSAYFLGGIISYSDGIKSQLLGVAPETLQTYGAVSRQTALEMARGARKALGADVGLAVTGIAGPGGASAEKPVGLTWLAVNTADGEQAESHIWQGDRSSNKLASADAVLELALRVVQEAI
jgi:PncC family amidohydrolase